MVELAALVGGSVLRGDGRSCWSGSSLELFTIFVFFSDTRDGNDFQFSTQNHPKALSSHWLFYSRQGSSVTPLIQFSTEGICLLLERTQFARSHHPVPLTGVDVSDGRVDDGAFRWATNLREIGKESGKVEETAIQSFSSGPFYCVVSSPTFCGVGTARGLALGRSRSLLLRGGIHLDFSR
jgi:hypothetical protein